MRYVAFGNETDPAGGGVFIGVLDPTGTAVAPLAPVADFYADPASFLRAVPDVAVIPLEQVRMVPPVPATARVLCLGLNYRAHVAESSAEVAPHPTVFGRFSSTLCCDGDLVAVPPAEGRLDWEAELVVVIGARARRVTPQDALRYVAGYCVGQDFSDRDLQMSGTPPQFSMGKSHENFSPIGPWLTTPDDCGDPDDLRITCDVNEVRYQDSSTEDMVTNVAGLIAYLSSVVEIRPGDVIFTGSPAGVGQGHTPPTFLAPGDVVTSTITGLGSLRNVTTRTTH